MSTPDPTQIVKAPVAWAKAKPVIFTLFVLIVFLVAIRFRETIASALSKIPVVGKWLTGIAHAGVFLVGAGLALLSTPRPAVIVHPSAPVAELCHIGGYFHGHAVTYAASLGRGDVLIMPTLFSGKGGAS